MEEKSDRLVSVTKDLLSNLGLEAEDIRLEKRPELGFESWVSIKSRDSKTLIGQRGETLRALNYIIRQIVNQPELFFVVDVNGYHRINIEKLKQKSEIIANRVKSFQSKMELEPMSSFERRCVHSFLSNDPELATESIGRGSQRRIVVSYKNIDHTDQSQDAFDI